MNNKFSIITGLLSVWVCCVYSCREEHDINYARYYTVGKQAYEQHCQNCHGQQGEGLAALIPPLTDTSYLRQRKNKIACIIRYGLHEEIRISGRTFNENMQGIPQLTEIDIAAIITYVTNSFGNKQGLYDQTNVNTDLKQCSASK